MIIYMLHTNLKESVGFISFRLVLQDNFYFLDNFIGMISGKMAEKIL